MSIFYCDTQQVIESPIMESEAYQNQNPNRIYSQWNRSQLITIERASFDKILLTTVRCNKL